MTNEILAEISLLKDNLAKAEKERDAAIADLRSYPENCFFCKYYVDENDVIKCSSLEPCCVDGNPDRWEWRGVQE